MHAAVLPVVIVDDDPHIRKEMEDFLRQRNRSVACAHDGASLIDYLHVHSEPTIVILDLHLPDLDIGCILRRLTGLSEAIVLILCSGRHRTILEQVAHLAEARNLRVAGALPKPISFEHLQGFLRQAEEMFGRKNKAAPSLPNLSEKKIFSEGELRDALAFSQFEPVYQPQYSFRDDRFRVVETLARWRHPELGILLPDQFLPSIKKTGLLAQFSEMIVRCAMTDLHSWQMAGLTVDIAINLPPALLEDMAFTNFVLEEVSRHGIDPGRIILELLEDDLLRDPKAVLDSLLRLNMNGFRVSIDDFGVEHSSLDRLLWLPISELKIDKSLTAAMDSSKNASIIVGNTIKLAHQMGLTVIAEGIEEESTLDKLKSLGCDAGQGFLFCRPLAADWLVAWMQRKNRENPWPRDAHNPESGP